MSRNHLAQTPVWPESAYAKKQLAYTSKIGITILECGKDEAEIFHALSPHFGVVPTITSNPVQAPGTITACSNRCISVGHKSVISESSLIALRKAGVKYISTRSIGCDHIDMEAAQRLGITVANTQYPPDGVADYTLMLILMAIRSAKSTLVNAQRHDFRLGAVRGAELRDLTVGVVGSGRIGNAVIERLRGFGCRVLAYSRNQSTNRVSLAELLEKSDVITLHAPLNTNTYHMIGHQQIALMKPGAFLINTARGALVDTAALIHALKTGKLGGAALDVLEGETGCFYSDCSQKPIDNPFLPALESMPNVIITPHTAYYTSHALHDTVEKTILNCIEFERSQHNV